MRTVITYCLGKFLRDVIISDVIIKEKMTRLWLQKVDNQILYHSQPNNDGVHKTFEGMALYH